LHDGSIVGLSGNVPGTVRVEMDIDYLRRRFPDAGKTIVVTLDGCTRFAYRPYEIKKGLPPNEKFITDFEAIVALKPLILDAEMRGSVAIVAGSYGVFEAAALGGSLSLDSGRTITLDELIAVAEAYWAEFRERSKKKTSD